MNLASGIGYILKYIQKRIPGSQCIAKQKSMDIICYIGTTPKALLPRHYCQRMLQGHYCKATRIQGTIARNYLPDYYCRDISARELMPGN
jgi:hypothetical protein